MNTVHDFNRDVRRSDRFSTHPIWNWIPSLFYPQCSPPPQRINQASNPEWQECIGADSVWCFPHALHLPPRKRRLLIEEKYRKQTFTDIALERVHEYDNGRRDPGWVELETQADGLLYVTLRIGKAWLINSRALRMAWKQHGAVWQQAYRDARSPNPGYWSVSTPVPPEELLRVLGPSDFLEKDFQPWTKAQVDSCC